MCLHMANRQPWLPREELVETDSIEKYQVRNNCRSTKNNKIKSLHVYFINYKQIIRNVF